MSDEEIRTAERAYRASGAPQDGEAYVQAVLRSTGVNSTFLIARAIETQRGLNTLLAINELRMPGGVTLAMREAIQRTVTPDDMVSFLRGGREWLTPSFTMADMQSQASVAGAYIPLMAPGSVDGYRRARPPREPPSVTNLTTPEDAAALRVVVGVQIDPNAHLPHQRGVPRGDAILCNHANENPGHCPCDPDCYCRQDGHTCSDVSEVYARHDGRDVECRLCSRNAHWQFRQEPRLHVCALHLAECRVNRAPVLHNCGDATCPMIASPMSASLAAMVRHHEAVDGDYRRCHNDDCTNMVPADGAAYCSNACAASGA